MQGVKALRGSLCGLIVILTRLRLIVFDALKVL